MMLRSVLHGIISFIPGRRSGVSAGGGDSQSARYCYSVWLRHIAMAHQNGLQSVPRTVAELGPGNSLGVGLCSLLSGVERCYAFDVVEHVNLETNLEIFDQLVELFEARAPIPDALEFPHVKPYLDDYAFPSSLLTDDLLSKSLAPERLQAIRTSLQNTADPHSYIQYKVPWLDADIVQPGSVDMIYSQAVLEHVDDLEPTYVAMRRWLREGGFISHQIDFRCHGTAVEWNGHWRYSDWIWRLIRGRRNHLINRMPYSVHRMLLERNGFELLFEKKVDLPSKYSAKQLARRFKGMSNEDIVTSGAFLQAARR